MLKNNFNVSRTNHSSPKRLFLSLIDQGCRKIICIAKLLSEFETIQTYLVILNDCLIWFPNWALNIRIISFKDLNLIYLNLKLFYNKTTIKNLNITAQVFLKINIKNHENFEISFNWLNKFVYIQSKFSKQSL